MSVLMDEVSGDSCLNYGKYLVQSVACSLCMSHKHNEINLLRVKKHMKFSDMAKPLDVSEKLIRKHFESHFIPSAATQRILNLAENTSQEAMEVVTNIMEGNLDIYAGLDLVLKSKAERLIDGKERLREMKAARASGNFSEEETDDTSNWCMVNKIVNDIEKSMVSAYELANNSLFPGGKDETSAAILSFKMGIAQGYVDRILGVLIQYENSHPELANSMMDLKRAFAAQFNDIELSIMKSGGRLNAVDNRRAIETTAVSADDKEEKGE